MSEPNSALGHGLLGQLAIQFELISTPIAFWLRCYRIAACIVWGMSPNVVGLQIDEGPFYL
eukprot:5862648-Amphidinium_carterae.1